MVLEIDDYVYKGVERRSGDDRRVRIDQRSSVRFDEKGGDRRDDSGRRSTDVNLEMWE
ncbi:MAG: hypothetical protein OEZ15_05100 [Gammaproteobacteria bacterium]|nr:hypothetical protein [Gammaproteobacteria bacterium]